MSTQSIAQLDTVTKTYHMGAVEVHALREVTIAFAPAEYISIMGPSGCGKSTLLNLLGCLDRPTSGSYLLGGEDVSALDDDALSDIRGRRLGFIFQSYNLIQQLTVLENIEVPLYYQGWTADASRERAEPFGQRVGLGDRLDHKPFELSGGQQQRVGIARALVNDPLILLADEPTGNLDSESGAASLELVDELHAAGKTIVMVTHDDEVGKHATRVVRLRDGRVEGDEKR